ncbi:MAG: DUF4349 domain-containing protein [Planctomycetes bacterium]|nr:DUF4349 domain-containing protein [Planctomycetota bacterium]
MTEKEDRQLAENLAELTRWGGEPSQLWRQALNSSATRPQRSFLRRFVSTPVPAIAAAGVIVVGAVATLVLISMPDKQIDSLSLLSSREQRPAARRPVSENVRRPPGPPRSRQALREFELARAQISEHSAVASDQSPVASSVTATRRTAMEDFPADRHVVRKATIELTTDDVRTAFLKAAQVISEARSEFVESSLLRGSGDEARAHLTLRVAADRLGAVLEQLRGLGSVKSEESHGEDVTTQVVDLQARLRNEQRIETELLKLLESRSDASLKDILELQRRINEVRQSIEHLVARRQQLGRLVDLATLLVIITPEGAPAQEPHADLGQYISQRLSNSWFGGLRILANTVAGGLRILVGGLPWWLLLGAIVVGIRHYRRQFLLERAVTEPIPAS